MLAALAAQPGPIHNVTIQDVPEPDAPQGGEVIVRMLASTFNPSDAVTVSGAYASRTEFPLVPGFDGVGVVERIGPEVPSTLLGCRVLPIGSAGAWQELKRDRSHVVHPRPRRHPHRCCLLCLHQSAHRLPHG